MGIAVRNIKSVDICQNITIEMILIRILALYYAPPQEFFFVIIIVIPLLLHINKKTNNGKPTIYSQVPC